MKTEPARATGMGLVFAVLFWAIGPEAGAAGVDGGSALMNALHPAQNCPHCGQRFYEDRSLGLLLIGFLGQLFFTSRFLVQWIASERRKESYMPHVFWYLSIIGSVLLFVYALSIHAWPVVLGQTLGVTVYSRNLVLITRSRKSREKPVLDPGSRAVGRVRR